MNLCEAWLMASPTSIETAIVEALTQTFFGSKANFGRSNWVTYLDESDADRWLIRSATGHTRDVTRTHGSYFDVPPLTIAERLESVMNATGQRMFGSALPVVDRAHEPDFTLAAPSWSEGIQTMDRVPDPRTLLPPLSVDTLVQWRIPPAPVAAGRGHANAVRALAIRQVL